MNSKEKKNYEISKGNVFEDLDLEESEKLLTQARFMHELSLLIKASKLSQKKIAEKLKISQSKVSLILNGKFNEFSTEKLMHYLSMIRCYVDINIRRSKSK